MVRQCELSGVSRSTVYRPREVERPDDNDLTLCALIYEKFIRHSFYGSRRIVVILKRQDWLGRPIRKNAGSRRKLLNLGDCCAGQTVRSETIIQPHNSRLTNCNGSRLKPVMLAFDGVFGSN